jgi:hypothetical protein
MISDKRVWNMQVWFRGYQYVNSGPIACPRNVVEKLIEGGILTTWTSEVEIGGVKIHQSSFDVLGVLFRP